MGSVLYRRRTPCIFVEFVLVELNDVLNDKHHGQSACYSRKDAAKRCESERCSEEITIAAQLIIYTGGALSNAGGTDLKMSGGLDVDICACQRKQRREGLRHITDHTLGRLFPQRAGCELNIICALGGKRGLE